MQKPKEIRSMPLIARETKKNRVNLQVRIADDVVANLELYCRFLESRKEYVIENLLTFAFKKDREFQDWRAINQRNGDAASSTAEASAKGPASDATATTAARRRAAATEAA